MSGLHTLTFGCTPYDHTAALLDGTITVDGYTVRAEPSVDIPRLFERVVRDREFDVAELGFTVFARSMNFQDPPFYALPVFLVRKFQHSTTYIHAASGIATPADLASSPMTASWLPVPLALVSAQSVISRYRARPQCGL